MPFPLPPCKHIEAEQAKEKVELCSRVVVNFRNVAWLLATMTSRMHLTVIKDSDIVLEHNGLTDLSLKHALKLTGVDQKNTKILIVHGADHTLGGLECNRVGNNTWELSVVPAVARSILHDRNEHVNHIGRELYISGKYATEISKDPGESVVVDYFQPIYFHPRFEKKDFDPSYFTVE